MNVLLSRRKKNDFDRYQPILITSCNFGCHKNLIYPSSIHFCLVALNRMEALYSKVGWSLCTGCHTVFELFYLSYTYRADFRLDKYSLWLHEVSSMELEKLLLQCRLRR